MKILVALSGGIDSAVTAHLLHAQGHELIGVRFTLWNDPLAPPLAQVLPTKCCNAQTAARSAAVAKTLGIPLHILDLEEAFKTEVVDPFLEGYRTGSTPNPCIRCNRTLKFGRLLELADTLGCEKLATGHYARIARETLTDQSERFLLLEAADALKDQSYYLYGLDQTQLSRVLFPLGGLRKADVRILAQKYGVPYEESSYRESQDLCFFPEKSPDAFLKRHLADVLQPGPIVRRNGAVVGTHRGMALYTVGQRRIGIGGLRVPLEVVEKDAPHNRLIVSERGSEQTASVRLRDVRWVSWSPAEDEDIPFECRTRSLSVRKHGTLRLKGAEGIFRFAEPQPPQAPGQSLVLYRGEEVVGGGVME